MKQILRAALAVLSKTERSKLLTQIVLGTLVSISDIGSLALLLGVIHTYVKTGTGSHAGDLLQGLHDVHVLLPITLIMMLFVLKNVFAYIVVRRQYRFIYDVASRIAAGNMRRYLRGSYSDYAGTNPSVYTAMISYQPMEYATFILGGIQLLFSEVALTGLAILAIILYDAKLFLILLLLLLPPLLCAVWISRKKLNAARSDVKESAEQATQHLQEALAGFIESNVYGKEAFFSGRYASSHRRLSATLSQLQITQAIPPRLIEVFAVFGLLILILLNTYGGSPGMEMVNVAAFVAAAYKIIPGISRIANTGAQMRMYRHAIESARLAVQDPDPAPTVPEPPAEIAFRGVSFSHDRRLQLPEISFELRAGELLGINAASGSGKTTVVNLLLGFLEPHAGEITVNGLTANADTRRRYWPHTGYVKQQSFLIHDTIAANIVLDDTNPDLERLQTAVRLSGLDEFVRALPEGLQKMVTDEGKNISGGQRQRIALARALYRDSPLLILDEPFSELDARSEAEILERLVAMAAGGKMIVLITHNAGSLQYCTKTLFL